LIDAVHYAPHFPIDVIALGCDFLLCSAYKFYGPHVGILYSRPDLLDRLQTDNLRTQSQQAPYTIETGTLNHAALSGVGAAVDYIASLGEGKKLRAKVLQGMQRVQTYEYTLGKQLYDRLSSISGLQLIGPSFEDPHRAPTLAFTLKGWQPAQICAALAEKAICAWQGHFYAIRPMEVLGLLAQGGVVRMGISLYNTEEEIEYTYQAIKELHGQQQYVM
jgi:selenocysteine lyase/cysteine desulfurase